MKLKLSFKVILIIFIVFFIGFFCGLFINLNKKSIKQCDTVLENETNTDLEAEDEQENIDTTLSVEFNREILNDSSTFSTTAEKIMIVAHPDDESIFGGNALLHDKYLVVCVTCGVVDARVKEFRNVMSKYQDDFIMLSYPDLVNNKKADWDKEYSSIDKEIKKILELKDWELVITHNPEGEYGHIHHKMINRMVTAHSDKDKLHYFGKFYWGEIPNKDTLYKLTDEEYKYKKDVIFPIYKTQKGAIENLKNMHPYESWITYNEWYGE